MEEPSFPFLGGWHPTPRRVGASSSDSPRYPPPTTSFAAAGVPMPRPVTHMPRRSEASPRYSLVSPQTQETDGADSGNRRSRLRKQTEKQTASHPRVARRLEGPLATETIFTPQRHAMCMLIAMTVLAVGSLRWRPGLSSCSRPGARGMGFSPSRSGRPACSASVRSNRGGVAHPASSPRDTPPNSGPPRV